MAKEITQRNLMEEENKKRVILVGIDGSGESTQALQRALRYLCTEHDSFLIVHAQPTASSKIKALTGYSRMYPDILKTIEDDIKRSTEEIFARAKEECAEEQVVAEMEAVTGDARDVLCNAVKEYNADMLVLGSHGNGPMK
ncbi:hypothetical protein KI387_001139, partial [Taxus chinensis]